jgi:hypothetical protein
MKKDMIVFLLMGSGNNQAACACNSFNRCNTPMTLSSQRTPAEVESVSKLSSVGAVLDDARDLVNKKTKYIALS